MSCCQVVDLKGYSDITNPALTRFKEVELTEFCKQGRVGKDDIVVAVLWYCAVVCNPDIRKEVYQKAKKASNDDRDLRRLTAEEVHWLAEYRALGKFGDTELA